jgi:hypothetical protein
LAIGFGWLVSLLFPMAFEISVILGYWLTNILGLILLHRSARTIVNATPPPNHKKEWLLDLVISFIYTVLIVGLAKFHIIEPLPNYFK